jgi:hypothetical protein
MDQLIRPDFPDDSFEAPLAHWLASGTAVLKGVYPPTSSGKTYSASRFVVEMFSQHGVIPIYIAPIKRLLEDFESEVRAAMKQRGLDIPIYRIYARTDFENDDRVLDEVIPFCTTAKRYLVGTRDLLSPFEDDVNIDDAKLNHGGKLTPAEWLKRAESAIHRYRRFREILKYSPTDQSLVEDMRKAMSAMWSGLNALCRGIVEKEILNDYKDNLFHHPDLRSMLLKLVPVNLFIQQPGIIIATASKFASKPIEYFVEYSRLGMPSLKHGKSENFFTWAAAREERFAILVDEEEEAYEYLFKALKQDLTNRDVDLHRVIYAFFHHFDLTGFSDYADYEGEAFARKFFDASGPMLFSLKEIKESILSTADLNEQIDRLGDLPCFSGFERAWLRILVLDFFSKHDIHNGFVRLKEKLKILETIKSFISETIKPWPDPDFSEHVFDVYRRLERIFHDKKRILASVRTLNDLRDDLAYLFFNERLEVFEHEVLERIRIIPAIAHHNLELTSSDALKEDDSIRRQRNSFSLGEFLRFVMLITRIMLKTPIETPPDDKKSRITDNQWSVLHRYRRKIGGWKIDKDALPKVTEGAPDETLSPETVFRRNKFALSIVEDEASRQEYADDLRTMSIAATVLKRTPEDLLDTFLSSKRRANKDLPGNIVYLISATGGLTGCWGGFNIPYMTERLADVNGIVLGATDNEMAFMLDFRNYRKAKRTINVTDFDRDNFLSRINPGEGYKRLEREILAEMEAPGLSHSVERNPYKLDELRYFSALLWRLSGTAERSAIGFTQTVSKVKAVLDGLARRGCGVSADESIRGLYRFDPSVFGGSSESIRVIVYTASFAKEPGRIVDGEYRPFLEDGEINEDSDESILEALVDERDQKLLFISGFRSASRGLSLTPKCNPERGGRDRRGELVKDFDVLMVAMTPYYDGLYRVPDQTLVHMERLQAMLQRLYLDKRLPDYTYQQMPAAIAEEHEEAFRDEYYRKIGRDMVQTFGRVERVEQSPTAQAILLNHEIVVELAHFHHLEPEFHNRLSAVNHVVYEHVQGFVKRTRMFTDESQWHAYVGREIVNGSSFLKASRRIYRGFRNNACRDAWARIRSPLMFTDPAAYIASLDPPPEGLSDKVWRNFVDYAFIPNVFPERYIVRADNMVKETPDPEMVFGEAVCEYVRGTHGQLVFYGDLYHSKGRRFDPVQRLVPPGLRSSPEFVEVIKGLGFDFDSMFKEFLPRAQFFNDYVKGYFAELIMDRLLSRRSGIKIIDPSSHPHAADIFERFDILVEGPERVIAIDLKNWSRRTDRLAGRRVREDAPRKSEIVSTALRIPLASQRKATAGAMRVEALTGKKVIPVYVNLCGERSHSQETLDGHVVHFFNLFVAERDEDNWTRYVLNTRLMNIPELNGKGQ